MRIVIKITKIKSKEEDLAQDLQIKGPLNKSNIEFIRCKSFNRNNMRL